MKTLDEMAARRPQRSIAWVWYALLALGAVIATFSHPVALIAAMLFGLYSRYLYRGGSVVVWFW